VDVEDIGRVYSMFVDVKRSTQARGGVGCAYRCVVCFRIVPACSVNVSVCVCVLLAQYALGSIACGGT